jgi:hypothetical protein
VNELGQSAVDELRREVPLDDNVGRINVPVEAAGDAITTFVQEPDGS